MNRSELIEVQTETAAVFEAGLRLAGRAQKAMTGRERGQLCAEALGASLGDPAAFWSGACVVESGNDAALIEALALGVRAASVKMAADDLTFVRQSLIGQSQWAGVLAVKLAAQAEGEKGVENQVMLIKLALAAQRQAAAALASAAALNKLTGAAEVTVGDF